MSSERDDAPAGRCRCDEALDRLEEYLDHETSELDTGRLQAHLSECASCLDEADYERRLRALLKRSCAETAPEALRLRVVSQLTVIRAEFRTR
jgi:anti-sigma factor (TIGR02949 family)